MRVAVVCDCACVCGGGGCAGVGVGVLSDVAVRYTGTLQAVPVIGVVSEGSRCTE
jgi:hypothetical protein